MAKFIVFALPRSRTAWMSEFLAYGGLRVGHDLTVECSSVQDFEDALDSVDGTVETGAVLGWRLLRAKRPELRIATVSRPLWEINESFAKLGLSGVNWHDMGARSEMLSMLSAQPGVLALQFSDLSSEAGCRALFEHCLGQDWDPEWWAGLASRNIQINMMDRIARLRANALDLELLRADMAKSLAELRGDSAWLN